jgi:hypothetical protein
LEKISKHAIESSDSKAEESARFYRITVRPGGDAANNPAAIIYRQQALDKATVEKTQNVFFDVLAELEGHLSSITDGTEITKSVLIKFSQSSSVRAKLLRLLRNIEYSHTRKKQKDGDSEKKGESSSESHGFKFQVFYLSINLIIVYCVI